MLEFTPKFMLLAWTLIAFVLFANYPIVTLFAMLYYMLIVPNEAYLWIIVGVGFLLFLILNAAGEKWFGSYYFMVLVLFIIFMFSKHALHLDIQATIGQPLQYATEQLKGGIVIFLDFISAFLEAELRAGFSLEFIISIIVPIYILFHMCMSLLVYSSVLSDRTCTYIALSMALVGARGGVLNGIIRWVETTIFNATTDPMTFTIFVLTGTFVLVAMDAILDILFYVMSVTPEERRKFWTSGEGGKPGKFSKAIKSFNANSGMIKSAKIKMLDPGKIAGNFASSQRMSTLQMRKPTSVDHGFGTMRRGAFSAAPVYNTASNDAFGSFFKATGGRE
ncbi:MAG: hypothetical protein QGG50_04025 [Methanopyri archaeon]|nr:hypothetical protein [Methanopyri archaeon]